MFYLTVSIVLFVLLPFVVCLHVLFNLYLSHLVWLLCCEMDLYPAFALLNLLLTVLYKKKRYYYVVIMQVICQERQ